MNTPFTSKAIRQLCQAALAMLLTPFLLPSAMATTASDIVGEITTVIGRGNVINGTHQQEATRGLLVRAGDRIETPNGGHVHVRFVDGGLVSVRPMSRLLIEAYRQGDATNLAAIKFRLEEGVMRSVTGHWGEANRDRFRLNTPIAAIGVKGTDFIVRADASNTLATVNTGAIVLAPLEGNCAMALGPCQGDRSVLLSADMQGQMIEYFKQNDSSAPRLVAAIDLLAQRRGTTPQGAEKIGVALQEEVAEKGRLQETLAVVQLQDSANNTVVAPDQSKPLIWLHNQARWNVPDNTISQRFDQALADGRTPVVGNFFINLYRDETVQKQFAPAPVTAAFQLQDASATYAHVTGSGKPLETVQISNAHLDVDFASSSLSTSMQLSSPTLGQNNFTANATVNAQGIFSSRAGGQSIAGAFSTDGLQAGYVFDKTVGAGKVSGLTLWGR